MRTRDRHDTRTSSRAARSSSAAGPCMQWYGTVLPLPGALSHAQLRLSTPIQSHPHHGASGFQSSQSSHNTSPQTCHPPLTHVSRTYSTSIRVPTVAPGPVSVGTILGESRPSKYAPFPTTACIHPLHPAMLSTVTILPAPLGLSAPSLSYTRKHRLLKSSVPLTTATTCWNGYVITHAITRTVSYRASA